MLDPTEPALLATYSAALALFTIAAVIRELFRKELDPALNPASEIGELGDDESPSKTELLPPPLPGGGVPTHFYNYYDSAGLALIFLIFLGLSIINLRMPADAMKSLSAFDLVASIFAQFVIAAIVMVLVIFRVNLIDWLGLRWKKWPLVFAIVPLVLIGMWGIMLGLQSMGYMQWMKTLGVESTQDAVRLLQESNDLVVLTLMSVAAVIVAPICEEIVFRGYFFAAAKKFTGTWVAAICSAMIFAAAHGSFAALLPIFILGFALAVVYEWTGSIWAPIAVHLCFNGATVGAQFLARALNIPLDSI